MRPGTLAMAFITSLGPSAISALHAHPQPVGTSGNQPFVQQVMGQPFPEADLQHLLHPRLRHHEGEQHGDNGKEDQELVAQAVEVALGKRIEERAMPLVEPHLANHIADEDGEDAAGQQCNLEAITRPPQVPQQGETLGSRTVSLPRRGLSLMAALVRSARIIASPAVACGRPAHLPVSAFTAHAGTPACQPDVALPHTPCCPCQPSLQLMFPFPRNLHWIMKLQ